MLRSRHSGPLVIVEGSDDIRVYERTLAQGSSVFVPALGRSNAVEAATILGAANFPGVVTIIDRDFDAVVGRITIAPNLFTTDLHDFETVALASPALEKVLAEYASPEKLQGKDPRQMLLSAGEIIGSLRFVSVRDGLNLRFAGINYSGFIDKATLKIHVDALIQEVKNKSQQPALDAASLRENVEALLGKHDPWQISCGHDMVDVLSIGLRSALGSVNSKETTPVSLERSLRLAYEKAYFAQTDLFATLLAWQQAHPQFPIVD